MICFLFFVHADCVYEAAALALIEERQAHDFATLCQVCVLRMYICTYRCVCVCVFLYISCVCVCVYVCVCLYISMQAHHCNSLFGMCIKNIYMYICVYVCGYKCVHIYIYIHICIYIHIYIYIYIYIRIQNYCIGVSNLNLLAHLYPNLNPNPPQSPPKPNLLRAACEEGRSLVHNLQSQHQSHFVP